jgi:hypothetical protein
MCYHTRVVNPKSASRTHLAYAAMMTHTRDGGLPRAQSPDGDWAVRSTSVKFKHNLHCTLVHFKYNIGV